MNPFSIGLAKLRLTYLNGEGDVWQVCPNVGVELVEVGASRPETSGDEDVRLVQVYLSA